MLIIVSGVQMLPSNRFVNLEHWPKAELLRLVDLIDKYHKSGVLFVSGDVHHAQFLQMNCGGFKIREITTSGLSHTLDNNLFGAARQFLKFITPRTFYYSEPMIEYNYANFRFE